MAGKPKYKWLADDQEVEFAAGFESNTKAALARRISPGAYQSHLRDYGLTERVQARRLELRPDMPAGKAAGDSKKPAVAEKPGVTIKGDQATMVTPPAPQLGDMDAMIRERGLDPTEWAVKNLVLNEWDSNAGGGEIIKLRQLKVHLVRLLPPEQRIAPARDIKVRVYMPAKPKKGDAFRWLAIPDPHAPYQDERMMERLWHLGVAVRPEGVIFLGDTGEYADISKHRDNPAFNAAANESIQGSYDMLAAARDAMDWARIVKLKGNHDWRLETEQLLRNERLWDVRPADRGDGVKQDRALSLTRLLHMDALSVELIEPELDGDDYDHAEFWLSPGLVAIHGKNTGSKTKTGAVTHAERMGASVVMGHTHRQNHHTVTRWTPRVDIGREDLDAAELGTCRVLQKSAGFVDRPNWQNGAGLVTVFADGSHQIELIRWANDRLHLRGQQW